MTVAGSGADGPRSFNHFCSKWMRKLESREKRNLSLVSFVRRGQWVIGEFVGYSRKAKKCKATPTGNASNPFVGRLVYDEIYYQKAGSTTKEARGSEARPAARTEVTEIFRFDGDDWVY